MQKQKYKPFIGQDQVVEEPPSESLELLEKYRTEFAKQVANGNSRKNRLEELMLRYSAQRWTAEKRARMTRRHLAAISQVDTATKILDQVEVRISQTHV